MDDKWFKDLVEEGFQGKFDSRTNKFTEYQNSDIAESKDETLNDLIFKALGSLQRQ